MIRRKKLAIVLALAGTVSLLIIAGVAWKFRSSRQGSQSFAGSFQTRGSSRLRRPPADFFGDKRTQTLIERAIAGDRAGVRSATAAGANVNERGKQGVTPLIVTLLNFSETGFSILLEAGADPNAFADNGDNAVTLAAIMPDAGYLRAALAHRGRVDGADTHGRTPLMLAATHARAAQVRLLVEAGADVNMRDSRGNSPLMFAMQAASPDREIVRLLLARGARAADTNPAGLTARDYAAAFEDPGMLQWFDNP